MSNLIDKTRTGFFHTIPAQITCRILGALYVVVLVKFLSVESYGVYNFVSGALVVLGFLCNFGLASSLQRFIPEYSKLNKSSILIKTILFSHLFRLILSLIVISVTYFTFDYWAFHFNIANRNFEYLIFVLGAFFIFQIEYFAIEFSAVFLHWASSIVQVAYSFLKITIGLAVLYFSFDLVGVLFAEAISYLIAFALSVWFFCKCIFFPYKEKIKERHAKIEFKRLGRYSIYNALVIPGNILMSHSMDYFVIAAMANPYQLGIYALASRISKMITSVMPQNILMGVIRTSFYHHYFSNEKKNEALSSMFNSLARFIAFFLFPCAMVIIVVADSMIVNVFSEEYSGAVSTFIIFVFFSIFTILEFPSDMVLQAIEKVQARLYAQIFAVYNVVAAIVLMPKFGIEGVAFATGSALMFKCLFYYYMVIYYTKIKICWMPIIKILINSFLTSIFVYFVVKCHSGLLWLFFSLTLGFIVYIIVSYLNNFMNYNEKKLANKFLRKEIFTLK